jgi:hypothetical protein
MFNMKSTEERLSEVYCRPKTEDEWVTIFSAKKMDRESSLAHRYIEMKYDLAYVVSDGVLLPLNGGAMWAHKRQMSMRTEIPVQHFLDLLNDSIVAWRLEEIGFIDELMNSNLYSLEVLDVTIFVNIAIDEIDIQIGDEQSQPLNLPTFTKLITFIDALGYKSE